MARRTAAWHPLWLLAAAVLLMVAQQIGWSRIGDVFTQIGRPAARAMWLALSVTWPLLLAAVISLSVGAARRRSGVPLLAVWRWRLFGRRRWLLSLAAVIGIIGLLALVLVAAPPWFVQDKSLEGLKAQNDVRTTLLQSLGGVVLLVGAYLTFRQLHTSREGQITERFTRAIDQLGHAELDVRLGGIYALERIARDSPADRDTIGEILTAYIRRHAPWPPTLPGQYIASAPLEDVPELQVRAPDIQASLTVLGRGFAAQVPEPVDRLDLRAVDLRRAYLADAELKGVSLDHASLAGSVLLGVDLELASLSEADLTSVDMSGASLVWVELHGANLEKVIFEGVILEHTNLSHANLKDAILGDLTDVTHVTLVAANLSGADLSSATLHNVNLKGARIDNQTAWPNGFDWYAAGATNTDEGSTTQT